MLINVGSFFLFSAVEHKMNLLNFY